VEFETSRIEYSYSDFKRGLILPKQSSNELAEFIGILTGDGYMNLYKKYFYMIEIAGDKRLDKDYLGVYVNNMINKLFNIKPTVYKRKKQNTMYLRILSKGILNYLLMIGFKKGKKEQIGIPSWIISDNDYMLAFLKGLADTDGSLYFRGGDYPIVSFTSKSEPLVRNVFNFLKEKGFNLTNYYKEDKVDKRGYNNSITYTIKLNGRKKFKLWSDLINFRNKRHLDKIKKWGRRNFQSKVLNSSHF
jgi:hypothetical protein